MRHIEIVAIGNELLLGDVLDTNSHELCRTFTGWGMRVRRVAQVPDEAAAIVAEVQGALQRGPDLLVCTGGLGPTDDDLTLAAVAAALGRPLEENPLAIAMLEERYRLLVAQGLLTDPTLTPARRKMARMPAGAEPLPNPVGTAPGVLLQEGRTTLVCLPGVPEEVRGILEGPLTRRLEEILGKGAYAEWTVLALAGEGLLAPLLREVVRAHPDVYVKSHARRPTSRPGGPRVKVTLSLAAPDPERVAAGLESALGDLVGRLAQAGIGIERISRGEGAPWETDPGPPQGSG